MNDMIGSGNIFCVMHIFTDWLLSIMNDEM